jgi:pyrimidine-nucleoside phosphorylase
MTMRIVDIIEKKKNGEALTDNEIQEMITSLIDGSLPD